MSPLICRAKHCQGLGNAGIERIKLFDFLVDENDDMFPASTIAGWHHIGTTRMGASPSPMPQ